MPSGSAALAQMDLSQATVVQGFAMSVGRQPICSMKWA